MYTVQCTVYEKTLCLSFCDLKSNEKLYTKRPKMAECYNAPLRTLSTCTVIAKQLLLRNKILKQHFESLLTPVLDPCISALFWPSVSSFTGTIFSDKDKLCNNSWEIRVTNQKMYAVGFRRKNIIVWPNFQCTIKRTSFWDFLLILSVCMFLNLSQRGGGESSWCF